MFTICATGLPCRSTQPSLCNEREGHTRANRVLRRTSITFLLVPLMAVATTIASGCDGTAPEGQEAPNPKDAPLVPYPADPDAIVSFVVVGMNQSNELKVVNRGQITKGAQWRLLFDPTTQPSHVSEIAQDGLDRQTSAIQNDVCWHGSPIVLNNGPGFSGAYMCFNNDDYNYDNEIDLTAFDPSYVVQSLYGQSGLYDGCKPRLPDHILRFQLARRRSLHGTPDPISEVRDHAEGAVSFLKPPSRPAAGGRRGPSPSSTSPFRSRTTPAVAHRRHSGAR